MRLVVANLLLLASFAVASPNGRQKRDLSTIRNWFSSSIFGRSQINIQPSSTIEADSRYKLYRLPGYDDILVKVMPRTPIINEYVYPEVEPINLNGFKAVVGNEINNNKLTAEKGLNNLLMRGNSNTKPYNVAKSSIPVFPKRIPIKVTEEKLKVVPKIEARPSVLAEGIQPYAERVQLQLPFEPKYSYIQMQNNQPVLTYTGHFNYNTVPVETLERKVELPTCIKQRIDDVIMLGADPYVQGPVQGGYEYQPSPVVDVAYPRVEHNFYSENPAYRSVNGGLGADSRVSPQPFKDGPVRYNMIPMKRKPINPRPLPMTLRTYPHMDVKDISASKSNNTAQTTKAQVFTISGDKVKISQTLGPYPGQYMAREEIGLPEISKEKDAVPMNSSQLVASSENIANANIPSYVYKYQINPNTGKMVVVDEKPKTNVKPNGNYYYELLAANSGLQNKHNILNNGVNDDKVTANPPSVTSSVTRSPATTAQDIPLKTNKISSYTNEPTPVPVGRGYSFQQKNADGSLMTVRSGKNGVSVDVQDRGDIPE